MLKKVGLAAAIVLVLGGFSLFAQASHDQIPYEELPMMGSEDAPVRIVEFADFKCPHCQTFAQDIFPQIKKEFIDTGVVAFYFMNFPVISQDSVTAGAAGAAIHDMFGDQAFWTFEQALFENQRNPRQTWATPEFLGSLAASVVDEAETDRIVRILRNGQYVDVVRRDHSIGSQIGVRGTPTIFVGDTKVQDYRNLDEIRSLINSKR